MARPTNDHHVLFPKKAYRTKTERKFRNQEGLLIRDVDVGVHNYLHRQVIPPPQPTKAERDDITDILEEARWYNHEDNPFWGAEIILSYYVAVEIEHPERAEIAREMRTNVAQQIGIFTVGHMPDTEEMKLFMLDGYVASQV